MTDNIKRWLKDNYGINYNDEPFLKFSPRNNNIPPGLEKLKSLQVLDLSNGNLTEIPKTLYPLFEKLDILILDNNKIAKIPQKLNDVLYSLTFFSMRNNPLTLLNNRPFNNVRQFAQDIKNNKRIPDDRIRRLIKQNNENVQNQLMDFHKTDRFNEKTSMYTTDMNTYLDIFNNLRFNENFYKLNNYVIKYLSTSNRYMNFYDNKEIEKDTIDTVTAEMIIDHLTNYRIDKEFTVQLIRNIMINELFYDEDLLKLLGKGSFNQAFELYKNNNLFIIKELIQARPDDVFDLFKEYLIGLIMTYMISDYLPNFMNSLYIYNLQEKQNLQWNYTVTKNSEVDVLCKYDNDYHFNYSQNQVNRFSNVVNTILNPDTARNKKVHNYYVATNIENSITMEKILQNDIRAGVDEQALFDKYADIIVQYIRAVLYSFMKCGFIHGDAHTQNILVNQFSENTYIKETFNFYRGGNPILNNYTHHTTKNVVTFIDYGLSTLIDKIDSSRNIVTYNSNRDENIDSHFDVHRFYYSCLTNLYEMAFNGRLINNPTLITITKIFYCLIGGFFYSDRYDVNMRTPDNEIIALMKRDSVYIDLQNLKKLDYGELPQYIRGKQRNNIGSVFEMYYYVMDKIDENMRLGYPISFLINEGDPDFQEYENKFLNDRQWLREYFESLAEKNENNRVIYEKFIYQTKPTAVVQITPDDEYAIQYLLAENTRILEFVKQNVEALLIDKKNEYNYLYIVKATSKYISNYRKLGYMFYVFYENRKKLKLNHMETYNICRLLNLVISIKTTGLSDNIKNLHNQIEMYYKILIVDKFENEKTQHIDVDYPDQQPQSPRARPVAPASPAPPQITLIQAVNPPVIARPAQPVQVINFPDRPTLRKLTVPVLKSFAEEVRNLNVENDRIFKQYKKTNPKLLKDNYITVLILMFDNGEDITQVLIDKYT